MGLFATYTYGPQHKETHFTRRGQEWLAHFAAARSVASSFSLRVRPQR